MSHSVALSGHRRTRRYPQFAKVDAASPGTLECRQVQVSLLIGRYAARTPRAATGLTPNTIHGEHPLHHVGHPCPA